VTLIANGVLSLVRPVDSQHLAISGQLVWIVTLLFYASWALAAVAVVRKPVIWLYADVGDTKARRTPQPLLNFERATLAAAGVSAMALLLAIVLYPIRNGATSGLSWLLIGATGVVILATIVLIQRAVLSEWTR
jgi:hypothetical protein